MKLNLKATLKSSLIGLAVLGVIGGSLNTPNVSAHKRYRTHRVYHHKSRRASYKFGYWKHHRYYHYKTGYFRNGKWVHKSYRHHARHKIYHLKGHTYHSERAYEIAVYNNAVFGNPNGKVKKHAKRHYSHHKKHQTVNKANSVAENLNEFKQQTITDINNDRQKNGLSPLTETPELEQLANTRAVQLQTNFNHVDGNYGENIDESSTQPYDLTDNTPVNNHNGYDMANNSENELLNHDADSDWGHRQNILSPDYTQMGIGVSYNQSKSDAFPYKLAEDFN